MVLWFRCVFCWYRIRASPARSRSAGPTSSTELHHELKQHLHRHVYDANLYITEEQLMRFYTVIKSIPHNQSPWVKHSRYVYH